MSELITDPNRGEVRLSFSSAFYGRGAIEQAGKDFSEACEVAIGYESEGEIRVVLKPHDDSAVGLDILGYEFCNYVLGLIQNAIY